MFLDIAVLSALPCQAKLAGFPDASKSCKWREQHKQLKRPAAKSISVSDVSEDQLFLHLPRERDVWQIVKANRGCNHLAVDLSQSVSRGGARSDGCLPTITPGSIVAVADAGRVICPLEKVMLHGFPVHRMNIPSEVTQKQLESMGGNTMHVQVVAVAIRLVLGLVDWGLPAAAAPCPAAPHYTAMCRVHSLQSKMKSKRCRNALQKPGAKTKGKTASRKAWAAATAALKARWGLPGRGVARSKQKGAKTTKQRVKRSVAVLKGTRWG